MVCRIEHVGEVLAFEHAGHLAVILHAELAPEPEGDVAAGLHIDALQGLVLRDGHAMVAYIHVERVVAVVTVEAFLLFWIATEDGGDKGIAHAGRDVGMGCLVLAYHSRRLTIVIRLV